MNFPVASVVGPDETDRSPQPPSSVSFVRPDATGEEKNSRAESDASAGLLSEHRWAELPVCAFLIGSAGERCQRCGASWLEHYPPGQERTA